MMCLGKRDFGFGLQKEWEVKSNYLAHELERNLYGMDVSRPRCRKRISEIFYGAFPSRNVAKEV